MNFTILYVILACIGTVGLIISIAYITKKFNVDTDKLIAILDPLETVFKFIRLVLIDMGIQEDELEIYSSTIFDTLEYLKTLDPTISKESRIEEAIAYCEGLLIKFGIELNETRTQIIRQLIPTLWNLSDAIKETQVEIE